MSVELQRRDIVVIGASAGGVQALQQLVAGLPADLDAAVFVVQHTHARMVSYLPELLSRCAPLPANHGVHGEAVVRGRIYVAPPDNHLMLRNGYLQVVRGPKENGHRPAVDALFRSASAAYGPRVIGIVLTGYLDCGSAGLLSIKARGGLAVVQDPRTAEVPDMPRHAIEYVDVDHVAALEEIPHLVAQLVRQPAGPWPARLPDALMEIEGDKLGVPAEIVCPLCNGKLTESELNGFHMLRCHVGHAFSLESVAFEQAEEVERALWAAMRSLEEGAALSRRMAALASGDLRMRFEEKVVSQDYQVAVLRRLLLGGQGLTRADVVALDDAPEPHRGRSDKEPD